MKYFSDSKIHSQKIKYLISKNPLELEYVKYISVIVFELVPNSF